MTPGPGNLQHVQSGQPLRIPASDWNKIIDATRGFFEKQATQGGGPATAGGRQTGIILVKNASGADQNRFAVLGIDAPIILPGNAASGGHEEEFKRQVALSCVVPVVPTHSSGGGRFVILLEPLAAGGIGRACVDGVCVVRLRVPHNLSTVAQADVVDGDSTVLELTSGGGAQVLWREDAATSPGDAWAVVRLGATTRVGYWARINGSADQSGNVWYYGFDQVAFDGTAWVAVPGGRFGDALDPNTYAVNTAEAGNGPTGLQGNGINVDTLNPGMSIQPASDNAVVWMRDTPTPAPGPGPGSSPASGFTPGVPPTRAVFFYLNGVDGTCI